VPTRALLKHEESFSKISNYFKDSWKELKKVNWPTKAETKKRTLEVLALAFLWLSFLL